MEPITLKLVIDGKEANATIQLTQKETDKLGEALAKLQRAPVLEQFSKELMAVNAVTEETTESVAELIRTNQMSEKEIKAVASALREQQSILKAGSQEWRNHNIAVKTLDSAYASVTGGQKQVISGTNSMNQTLGQFGFMLGDSDMFLVNFQMGMRSIANNIPMVAQGFIYAAKEAKELNTTVGKQLVSSLMGAGGLMVAINGVMLLLNLLPALLKNSTEEIKKQAEEVKKLRDEYKKLTEEQLKGYLATTKEGISSLEQKYPKSSELVQVGGIRSERFERRKISNETRFGDDYEYYKTLQNRQKALEEEIKTVGYEDEILRRIEQNTQKRKSLAKEQYDADTKLKKTGYWKDVVPEANSYEDAKNILNGWIAADQKVADHIANKKVKEAKTPSASKNAIETTEQEIKNAQLTGADVYAAKQKGIERITEALQNENLKLAEQNALLEKLKELNSKDERFEQDRLTWIKKRGDEEKWQQKQSEEIAGKKAKKEQETANAYKEYYEIVKFADDSYYQYKVNLIDKDIDKLRKAGLSEIALARYKNEEMKKVDEEYNEWKWEQYKKDNKIFASSFDFMSKAYDDFFNTVLDTELSGKEKMQRLWTSLLQNFVGIMTDMVKEYLGQLIKREILSEAYQTAEIASATATGTAISAAYAPAAAFASIASFGAASIAGSAGLASTVALAYLLSVPKYAKGGLIRVNEEGQEYVVNASSTKNNLALLEAINNNKSLNFDTAITERMKRYSLGSGLNYISDNSSLLNKLDMLTLEVRKLGDRPVEANVSVDSKNIVRSGIAKLKKGRL